MSEKMLFEKTRDGIRMVRFHEGRRAHDEVFWPNDVDQSTMVREFGREFREWLGPPFSQDEAIMNTLRPEERPPESLSSALPGDNIRETG